MTFVDYLKAFVNEVVNYHHFNLRIGQMMFNALEDMDIKLANSVLGTNYDPYYDDDNIPEFLNWLQRILEDLGE